MVANKRGWIRILEATIAILIIGTVLLSVYSTQIQRSNPEEFISNIQEKILLDFASNQTLRKVVIEGSASEWDGNISAIQATIPSSFDTIILRCDLLDQGACQLTAPQLAQTLDKEVFVKEKIIAVHLGSYEPKKVRFYMWSKG